MAVWKKISPDDALVDRIVAGVERWKRSNNGRRTKVASFPTPRPSFAANAGTSPTA